MKNQHLHVSTKQRQTFSEFQRNDQDDHGTAATSTSSYNPSTATALSARPSSAPLSRTASAESFDSGGSSNHSSVHSVRRQYPKVPSIKSGKLSYWNPKPASPLPVFIPPKSNKVILDESPEATSPDVVEVVNGLPVVQSPDEVSPVLKRRKLVRKADLARELSPDPITVPSTTLAVPSPVKEDSQEVVVLDDESGPASPLGNEEEESLVDLEICAFLNTAPEVDLIDCLQCTKEQATELCSARPLNTFSEWKQTCSPPVLRLIHKYKIILQDLGSVDGIIKHCDFTGKEIKRVMDGWEKYTKSGLKEDLYSRYECIAKQPAIVCQDFALKHYQLVGVSWMLMLFEKRLGGILADEMGLGKTAQVIAFLGTLLERGYCSGPHLIIVPSSTLDNWMREIGQWCPTLKAIAYTGTMQERIALQYDIQDAEELHVVVTTYTIATGNAEDRRFLRGCRFQTLFLDEGHMIKNGESQRAKHLRNLKIPFKLLITGTPMQNNLMELLSLLTFIMPELFEPARASFEAIFDLKPSNNQLEDDVSRRRLDHAGKIMAPFVLRRRKDDEVEFMDSNLGYVIEDLSHMSDFQIHQLCCRYPVKALKSLIPMMKARGDRILLFSQFVIMLDILELIMNTMGITFLRLDGGIPGNERLALIDKYNSTPDITVFLLSTKACGLGINLTSANVVILYDIDFNPHNDAQAEDRAHRVGQQRPVQIVKLILKDSVEQHMLTCANFKLLLDNKVQDRDVKKSDKDEADPADEEKLLDLLRNDMLMQTD
ncbi:ATP-dependent helicase smarcad1 [Kappamyces sp. JEL0680]|nr:ATP-dependent helicase smarcad1 [Kappamyces sp. JEL0680]